VSTLRGVSLTELEQLQGAVEGGDLRCPVKKSRLLAAGLDSLVSKLAVLDGLEQPAVAALLRAVIAERRESQGASLDLVWTGPDLDKGVARDTAIIVRELLGRAEREVVIGGCYFTDGLKILQPLHTAMQERGVRVTFCMDIADDHCQHPDPLVNAQRYATAFVRKNWSFGEPVPNFYFDPRTAKPGAKVKLHAKCIVVDNRWSLVTSANFTYLGQHQNIEAGALIDDVAFSTKLAGQWHSLIHEHKLRPCPLPDDFAIVARVVPEGWTDAEECLDGEWGELVDALIDAGVPGPDDYGAELTVDGVVSEQTTLMHWGDGPTRVSLVAAEQVNSAGDGVVLQVSEAADFGGLAAKVTKGLAKT